MTVLSVWTRSTQLPLHTNIKSLLHSNDPAQQWGYSWMFVKIWNIIRPQRSLKTFVIISVVLTRSPISVWSPCGRMSMSGWREQASITALYLWRTNRDRLTAAANSQKETTCTGLLSILWISLIRIKHLVYNRLFCTHSTSHRGFWREPRRLS